MNILNELSVQILMHSSVCAINIRSFEVPSFRLNSNVVRKISLSLLFPQNRQPL